MTTVTASASDAIKEQVLLRIKANDGRVEGEDLHEIRKTLELEEISLSVLKSALWKLTVEDRELEYFDERDDMGCGPRCAPVIYNRIYRVRI